MAGKNPKKWSRDLLAGGPGRVLLELADIADQCRGWLEDTDVKRLNLKKQVLCAIYDAQVDSARDAQVDLLIESNDRVEELWRTAQGGGVSRENGSIPWGDSESPSAH